MNKKKLLCVLVIILAISLLILGITLNGRQDKHNTQSFADASNVDCFTISTDFCILKYPEKWEDTVQVDVKQSSVIFSSNETSIFTLWFNEDKGYALGSFEKDGDTVTLSIESAELDEKNKNYDDCCAMQEDVNVTLFYLQKDYDFKIAGYDSNDTNTVTDDAEVATFEINTNVVTLLYPEKWKDKVTTDVTEDSVLFSCGEDRLFKLNFGGKKGYLLGTYDKTQIRLEDYEVKNDEEAAMQEDVNVILQHLMKNKKFKVHTEN